MLFLLFGKSDLCVLTKKNEIIYINNNHLNFIFP